MEDKKVTLLKYGKNNYVVISESAKKETEELVDTIDCFMEMYGEVSLLKLSIEEVHEITSGEGVKLSLMDTLHEVGDEELRRRRRA